MANPEITIPSVQPSTYRFECSIVKFGISLAGPLETGSTPVEESTSDVLYALRRSGHKVHRSRETPGAYDSAEAVTSKYAQEASRTPTTASSVAYLRRPVPEARTLRKDVLLPSSRTQ